jgi:hypothetical protein
MGGLMRHKLFCNIILGISIIIFLIPIELSFSQQVLLKKIINDSKLIVVGRVTNIESRLGAGKNIWTYVTLKCDHFLKGDSIDKIIIKIPGGIVGDLGQSVSGTPKYLLDELTLNFLGQKNDGEYYVNGWESGKYTYQNGVWIQRNRRCPQDFIAQIKSMINQ